MDPMMMIADFFLVFKSNFFLILVSAPTTKAVGFIDVTKLVPTALVAGLIQNKGSSDF